MTVAGPVAVALAAGVAARHSTAGSSAAPAKDGEKEDLILNSSSRDRPKLVANILPVDDDSVEIRGWVVTRGQAFCRRVAASRRRHTASGRSASTARRVRRVEQAFVTKTGQNYKVTFSMSGNPSHRYRGVPMAVRATGKKEVFEFDMTKVTQDDPKWETKAREFTAVSAVTILAFRTAMTRAHPLGGPPLDDVKVVAAD